MSSCKPDSPPPPSSWDLATQECANFKTIRLEAFVKAKNEGPANASVIAILSTSEHAVFSGRVPHVHNKESFADFVFNVDVADSRQQGR